MQYLSTRDVAGRFHPGRRLLRMATSGAIVLLCAQLGNAQVQEVRWRPGSGPVEVLHPEPAVNALDSVASTGAVEVEGTLAQVNVQPVVAYAIQFDVSPEAWYELGVGQKYFSVEPARIVSTRQSASTEFSGTIPMVDTVCFSPNMQTAQVLHVWVGREGLMTVDGTAGVFGFDHYASYAVLASIPERTVIPDRRSIEGPIFRAGLLEIAIFRASEMSSLEPYTITLSGPAPVLECLVAPVSVFIPGDEHIAEFLVDFDPSRTVEWPPRGSQVSLTATSASASVTCTLNFSGALGLGALAGAGPGSGEVEPFAEKDCIPASVLGPQPSISTKCGKCVKFSVTPECPPDSPGSGAYLWYYPYQCPKGSTTCTPTSHTGVYQGTDCNEFNRNCKPDGGVLAHMFPATVGSWVAKVGHQCCFNCSPSSAFNTYTFPTCN